MSWRCFLAITLPREAEDILIENQKVFRKTLKGSFSVRQNLHLTLKFIGDISEENYSTMKEALHERLKHPKFTMQLGTTGLFTKKEYPIVRTIWTGIHGSEELQQNIEGVLSQLQIFPRDKKPYTPHITLVRPYKFLSPDVNFETIQQQVSALNENKVAYEFQVEEFHIFKSTLQQGKAPIYEIMDTIQLY